MNTNILKSIAAAASMIFFTSSAMAHRDFFDTSYAFSVTQTIENQSNKLLKELNRTSYHRHPSTRYRMVDLKDAASDLSSLSNRLKHELRYAPNTREIRHLTAEIEDRARSVSRLSDGLRISMKAFSHVRTIEDQVRRLDNATSAFRAPPPPPRKHRDFRNDRRPALGAKPFIHISIR
ncbi:MAG: hypothetical protein JW706_03680 [Opitutales bacterium]|nr:hypothetical protein [Opitutales bacterium]